MWIETAVALAQDAGGSPSPPPGGSFFISILPFLFIFIIFYFLLILPQQRQRKKHKAWVDALKKGDKVLTSSGFLGTVANIHKDVVTLQLAENLKLKVKKDYISGPQTGEEEG
jgi:preprotein translocase subunit YajC